MKLSNANINSRARGKWLLPTCRAIVAIGAIWCLIGATCPENKLAGETFPFHLDRITPSDVEKPVVGTQSKTVAISLNGSALPIHGVVRCSAETSSHSLTVSNIHWLSSSHMTAEFTITGDASPGGYSVWVEEGSAKSDSVGFGISSPAGDPDFAFTATPSDITIADNVPSGPIEFKVASLNNFSGPVKIHWETGGVVPDPADNDFTVNVTPSTPAIFTRTLTRPYSADDVHFGLEATDTEPVPVRRHPLTVIIHRSAGNPDFAITASPLQVTVANGVSSAPVQFTVSSIGGFSGQVKVTWVADGDVAPQPIDNNFTANISPGTPYTFSRTFYRFTTGTEETPIFFNVTDIPFTTTRSVTVVVKAP